MAAEAQTNQRTPIGLPSPLLSSACGTAAKHMRAIGIQSGTSAHPEAHREFPDSFECALIHRREEAVAERRLDCVALNGVNHLRAKLERSGSHG